VIPAIGQLPDLDAFDHDRKIHLANNGDTLVADPLTLNTNVPGIFAGGDVVHGPESMVEAVAAGRRAAVSIDRYLRGEDIKAGRTLETVKPVEVNINQIKIPPGERRRIPCLPIKKRVKNFEEVETGYTTVMALRESRRCLNCGGCSDCMECVRVCEVEAVDHSAQPQEAELEAGVVVFAASPEGLVPPGLLEKPSEKGIYIMGSGLELWDMPKRLTHASAVAGRVIAGLAEFHSTTTPQYKIPQWSPLIKGDESGICSGDKPAESPQPEGAHASNGESRIGVFICRCGGNISDVIDTPRLVRHFFRRSGVAYAQEIGYACSDAGALEIRTLAKQFNLTHVVLAACPCCALDQICFSCSDRRIECKAKLLGPSKADGLTYEFVNIREHCAWVHTDDGEEAREKAKTLILAGIARVRKSRPIETKALEVRKAAMVIGGGLGGFQAAVDLSSQGFQTTLIRPDKPFEGEGGQIAARLLEELQRHGGRILKGARLEDVRGSIGAFHISAENQGEQLGFNVGAIVVDISTLGAMHLPKFLNRAINISRSGLDHTASRMPGVFLCGTVASKRDFSVALVQGSAAASKALALLCKGEVKLAQTIAKIDPRVCRGCGTCVEICEFGAPSLVEQSPGVLVSRIDESLCRGCGTCVAHCPSCAIDQNGLSDGQITASLEAMLARG
ncbi:MAG: 4Fe-4S dicluster domain-containing protein, partial [Dehalococcoidia bacterium]